MNAFVPFVYHGIIFVFILLQLRNENVNRLNTVSSLVIWLLSLGATLIIAIANYLPASDVLTAQKTAAGLLLVHLASLIFSMVYFIRREEKNY